MNVALMHSHWRVGLLRNFFEEILEAWAMVQCNQISIQLKKAGTYISLSAFIDHPEFVIIGK